MTKRDDLNKLEYASPDLKAILNDGDQLAILNYKKPFSQKLLGRFIDREIDFQRVETFITPIEQWIVRNHFNVPSVDIEKWYLFLEGNFKQPTYLSMEELKEFKTVSKVVTIECTGNSGSAKRAIQNVSIFQIVGFANPLKWKEVIDFFHRGARHGMISTAEFKGIRLLELLEKHPPNENTVELVFQGLDKGYDRMLDYLTLSKIHYERSMTLEEINEYDPIICFEMNGKPLLPVHGFPLRMVFSNIMGADQVKWLSKIVAITEPFNGNFMKNWYRNKEEMIEEGRRIIKSYPARKQKVKSIIIRILKIEEKVVVFGLAWCGRYPVKEVLVSSDNCKSWNQAIILHEPAPHRWVFWKCVFENIEAGRTTFIPRAFDSKGYRQPIKRNKHIFYQNNEVIPAVVNIS